jgi:ribosomal peptide maturation radical SAM protein 1
MVDNILDPRYFTTFLPELAKAPCARAFFYEVKANLKPEELDLLARCGVDWIQPGIESLNDHVLSIMKKGTTALRNIQLLKLCSERGIRPIWNLLCGVPGERSEDYRATLDLIPLITHLPPPVSCATITIHRFSPFFEQPGPSGLRNLRPQSGYRAVYPFSEAELFDVAYEFDCDFDRAEFSEEYFHDLQTMVQYWQERFDAGMERLSLARLGPDACVILDRRVATGAARTVLRGLDCAIYSFCGTIRNAQSVLTHLRASFPNKAVSERETKDRLDRLVALRFMVNEGDCYLGLATPSRSWPAK